MHDGGDDDDNSYHNGDDGGDDKQTYIHNLSKTTPTPDSTFKSTAKSSNREKKTAKIEVEKMQHIHSLFKRTVNAFESIIGNSLDKDDDDEIKAEENGEDDKDTADVEDGKKIDYNDGYEIEDDEDDKKADECTDENMDKHITNMRKILYKMDRGCKAKKQNSKMRQREFEKIQRQERNAAAINARDSHRIEKRITGRESLRIEDDSIIEVDDIEKKKKVMSIEKYINFLRELSPTSSEKIITSNDNIILIITDVSFYINEIIDYINKIYNEIYNNLLIKSDLNYDEIDTILDNINKKILDRKFELLEDITNSEKIVEYVQNILEIINYEIIIMLLLTKQKIIQNQLQLEEDIIKTEIMQEIKNIEEKYIKIIENSNKKNMKRKYIKYKLKYLSLLNNNKI
jgi:hypothetical protein